MINAIYNAKNPYQGEAKRVLCVCSAGLLRSPTAAVVLERKYGYNTRACGLDTDHALIPISDQLIYWADEIICMEEHQRQAVVRLVQDFNEGYAHVPDVNPLVYTLEVPDMYKRMDSKLQEIIHKAYAEVLLKMDEGFRPGDTGPSHIAKMEEKNGDIKAP